MDWKSMGNSRNREIDSFTRKEVRTPRLGFSVTRREITGKTDWKCERRKKIKNMSQKAFEDKISRKGTSTISTDVLTKWGLRVCNMEVIDSMNLESFILLTPSHYYLLLDDIHMPCLFFWYLYLITRCFQPRLF